MAIRPRLYGLEDEALDEVYRSGTDAARQQLAGVDVPASDMEPTLDEAEAELPNVPNVPPVPAERPDLGTVDPWAGEPRRTPLTATTRTPGFQTAGAFPGLTDRRALRSARSFDPSSIRSTTPQAPLPDVPTTLLLDEPEPYRFAPTATIGERPQQSATVRRAPSGTPLLGIDSATAHEEAQSAGLPGIDTPASVRKSATNPYELTADERARLARAERSDRNINIARTIFGGLSGLTQMGLGAAGNVGAASGVGQAMSGYQPMQSAVSDRVSQRIDRDRTQRVQAAQYDQQQQTIASEDERRRAEAERQARLDESQLELRAAQTMRANTEAQQMQTEWDQLQGNRQAGVQWLRSLASHYRDSGEPLIAEILAGTEPGGFLHNASMDQLNRYAQQLTAFATAGQIAGRAGIGARPGRPGAYTEVVNADGTVSRVPVPGSGGSGRRASRGTGAGPIIRPTTTPQGASQETIALAEQALGEPLNAGEDASAEIFIQALRARGIDPASPTGREALRAQLHTYRYAPSAAAQAEVITGARETLINAAAAQAGGLPANVDPAGLRQMTMGGNNSASAAFEAARAMQSFISRFRGYMQESPDALNVVLRAAGSQDGVVAAGVDAAANRIRQDLQRHINTVLSKLAGANVTDNEMVRNLRALGTGSLSSNSTDFLAGLNNQLAEMEDQFQARSAGVPPATVDYWIERATRSGGR